MTICGRCKLPQKPIDHSFPELCVVALRDSMIRLLESIGDKSTCLGCGAEIYWVHHRNGKRAPYTPAGLNHFIDCPKAAQFKTKKEVVNG